jgi:hypothetical protein
LYVALTHLPPVVGANWHPLRKRPPPVTIKGMRPNPYEAPSEQGYEHPAPNRDGRRDKPWWGYFAAILVGMAVIGSALGLPLVILDDSGGLQMLIGAFLGLVIYRFLF